MVAKILINSMTVLFKILLGLNVRARTRTWNVLIRSQTPYPLGHAVISLSPNILSYGEANFGAGLVGEMFQFGAILNCFRIKSYDKILEENIRNQQGSPNASIKRAECHDEVHVQNQVKPEEIKLFQIKIKNP